MLTFNKPFATLALAGVFLFLALAAVPELRAGAWTQQQDGFLLKAYLGQANAVSYYDKNGDLVNRVATEETLSGPSGDTTERTNTEFSFDQFVLGLYAEYGLSEDLTLVGDFPFGVFALEEEVYATRVFINDDNNLDSARRSFVNEFSLASFAYYGIGLNYQVLRREKLAIAVSAMLRIPPGFSKGIVDNPDYDFLSDGAFEFLLGFAMGAPTKLGWVQLSADYNMRGEEYEDEITVHAETGFSNIPQAFFKLQVDLKQSLGSVDEARPFNIRETQLLSNYMAAGAAFTLFLEDIYFLEANYTVRILGANAWSLNTVVVGGGIRI